MVSAGAQAALETRSPSEFTNPGKPCSVSGLRCHQWLEAGAAHMQNVPMCLSCSYTLPYAPTLAPFGDRIWA